MAEAMGDEATNKTLVLHLEGRPIPALGKRVRIMLRKLKISHFNKVKILVDGQEAETSDETDSDYVAPLDMCADADTEGGDQFQPSSAGPTPDTGAATATVALRPAPTAPHQGAQPQDGPGTAPPADTKALFAGLDAESQRQINAATDQIFYEKGYLPKDTKIASKSDPNAEIWLAVRQGVITRLVSDPDNPARQVPPPAAGDEPQPQWSQHLDIAENYFRNTLKLTEDEVQKLELFSQSNAMATENGDQKGAERLIEALSDKSSLGPLRDEMKTALCYDFAMMWMYSPDFHEDGAEMNLDAITKYAKSVPGLAEKMANVFRQTAFSVPNRRFDGSDYDVLEKERDNQASLFGHAIDLDLTGTAKGVGGHFRQATGRDHVGSGPRRLDPRLQVVRQPGPLRPQPAEAQRGPPQRGGQRGRAWGIGSKGGRQVLRPGVQLQLRLGRFACRFDLRQGVRLRQLVAGPAGVDGQAPDARHQPSSCPHSRGRDVQRRQHDERHEEQGRARGAVHDHDVERVPTLGP